MKVSEFCTRSVIIASRNTPVQEAALRMRGRHSGTIIIVDEADGRNMPAGVITDRDIAIEVVAAGLNYADLTVGDLISGPVTTARETDGVFEVIQLMQAAGVRRLPIVDSAGSLAGIIALDDIIELLAEELGNVVTLLRQERRNEIEMRV
jgi:signal-transduction protein with cAMP-binding, CBS, and nucleotidyltransferase domain